MTPVEDKVRACVRDVITKGGPRSSTSLARLASGRLDLIFSTAKAYVYKMCEDGLIHVVDGAGGIGDPYVYDLRKGIG